ncbi:MAG: hypothetical protein E2P04_04755 [Acidobacteria bacterium]|nr:MAG: hypothetical protein E2P04_04755 [Acidobacteriota bacterium]
MAKKKGGGKGCFKWGCIGCVGLLVLVILLMAIFSGVAWQRVQSQEVKEEVLTHELPGTRPAEGTPDADDPAAPGDTETRTEILEHGRPGNGRVILDLSSGGFFISPAEPGDPLRVEATYDVNSFQLVEGFEEKEDGTWTYSVSFRRTGSMMMALLGQLLGGADPEVHIYLPPDAPLALDVKLRQGGSQIELGGLWLTSADIDFARSGFMLEISEPLKEPMDSLTLTGMMGGANLEGIGNASPRKLEVYLRMGGMNLDLRGQWMQDSDISITWDMGGASVVLPANMAIQGVEGYEGVAPGGEVPPPTLRFELDGKMDDIHFEMPRRRRP